MGAVFYSVGGIPARAKWSGFFSNVRCGQIIALSDDSVDEENQAQLDSPSSCTPSLDGMKALVVPRTRLVTAVYKRSTCCFVRVAGLIEDTS